ncbi:MAG TPA: pilus assembly PilX N-terminal domain-containing protein, partial [Polyangia bacterium]
MGVSNRSHSRGEIDRGVALITVMLVMLALLGLGITALWITSGNLKIVATTSLRTQALYVAEAGIEAVRSDLNGAAPRDLTRLLVGDRDPLDDLPTGRGVDDSGQPNGVGAIYTYVDGTRLRDVAFPPARFQRGSAGTAESPVSTTMGTYTVWIRNDTGELRQGKITMDGNGSVVVRSRGVAVDGRT